MSLNVDAAKRGIILNSDPADDVAPVAASDTNDVWGAAYNASTSKPCRGLLVGTAGDATVVTAAGNTRTLIPLQAGYNPIRVRQVKLTGLTAANIWALT